MGRVLAVGVVEGLWRLEDLDEQPCGRRELEDDRARSAYPADRTMPREWRRVAPVIPYPAAGQRLPHRNLAREWIEANPGQWQELLSLREEAIRVETQTGVGAGR